MDAAAVTILVPFSRPVVELGPVRRVKSTLVSSSLQEVRARGLSDRYFELLEPDMQSEVRAMVAGMWIDVGVAAAHYSALEALFPWPNEQLAMGRVVADKVQRTMLSTLVRLAASAGVTPWVLLERASDLWGRVFDGGGLEVKRLGPKDARLSVAGAPLLEIGYFRTAFRGVIAGCADLVARKCFVNEEPMRMPGVWSFRMAWA